MTKQESKRISELLNSINVNRVMSDSLTEKGEHREAARWMRKESALWVELSEEFGIATGAIEVHRKVAGVAA
jgi:hypothetical protein